MSTGLVDTAHWARYRQQMSEPWIITVHPAPDPGKTIGEQVRDYKARALATGNPEDAVVEVPDRVAREAGHYGEIMVWISGTNEAPKWMVDLASDLVGFVESRRGGTRHWAFILADTLAPYAQWKPPPGAQPRSSAEWQRDVRHCLESVRLTVALDNAVPACIADATPERIAAAARSLALECTKPGKRKQSWGLAVVVANELGFALEKKLAKASRVHKKRTT